MTAPETFTVGQDATAKTAADHTMRWHFTVTARTARTARYVTLQADDGTSHRVAIRTDPAGNEWAMPFGRYALAPVARPTNP